MPTTARSRKRSLFVVCAALCALPQFTACAPLGAWDEEIGDADLHEKLGPSEQYEAESRSSEQGCSLRSNHAGFTGSGFMDYGGNGTWIEWTDIQAAAAGEYELRFRYANGSGGDRSSDLIVNGSGQGPAAFSPSGGWKTWTTTTANVMLREGRNTLRVVANTGRGGPNLDHVVVTAVDLCPNDPTKDDLVNQ